MYLALHLIILDPQGFKMKKHDCSRVGVMMSLAAAFFISRPKPLLATLGRKTGRLAVCVCSGTWSLHRSWRAPLFYALPPSTLLHLRLVVFYCGWKELRSSPSTLRTAGIHWWLFV